MRFANAVSTSFIQRSAVLRGLASLAFGGLLTTGCYFGADEMSGADGDTDGESNGGETEDAEGSDTTPGEPPSLECAELGGQPLRRISSVQYIQILEDVLPAGLANEAIALEAFPRTMIADNFSTFATANTVSVNESIQIEDNAEAIAGLFYDNRAEYVPALVPCVAAGYQPAEIDGCIEEFVETFGARMFRRPLTDGESTLVLDLYNGIRDGDGQELALAAVLQYFLQAPGLLYLTEQMGEGDGFKALNPSELAARLAMLFLNSVPDAELLLAVEEGRLQSREDVEREARRLVANPEVSRAVAQFHHEWMRGFALENAERDHELWNDDSKDAMSQELKVFAQWFLEETDGRFQTLMTTPTFPADGRLAAVYDAGGAPPRTGLLTTAAAMAAQAHGEATSLVERGAFLRNHVLCIPTPAFPGNIDTEATLGEYGDLPTQRQRLEPLMLEPSCSGCHTGINPFGFPFEIYDWAGAYRAEENGEPIDTTVSVELGSISGTFANAAELLEVVAASEEAQTCYATHWFRYALGRPDAPEDACSLDQISTAFVAAEGDVRELMVAVAVSDAFRFRKVGGAQ